MTNPNLNPRQFFHGTNADLSPGDHIGAKPHAYFTTEHHVAMNYAYAKARSGSERRVYRVRPTGPFEVDPNDLGAEDGESPVMYRSKHPLEVIE